MNEEQRRQVEDRDRAVRACMFAVDDAFLRDPAMGAQLRAAPPAVRSRVAVEAAIGYLVGQGLIEVKPDSEWPEYLPMQTPEHLLPAVDEYIAGNQRLRDALLGGSQ